MDEHGRTITVVFGPSRSRFLPETVAHARAVASELTEVEPGRFRAVFRLGTDRDPYAHLSALVKRVRNWRGSEVYLGGSPVSSYLAKEMGWCAGEELRLHGGCRYRFGWGVPHRCGLCPLFDAARAGAESRLGPLPHTLFIDLRHDARGIVRDEVPDEDEAEVPDFLPEEWGEPPF